MIEETVTIREANKADATELVALLNEIIEIGGTTAYQKPLSEEDFADTFLIGPDQICCFTAEDQGGKLAGFQALEHRSRLPGDWGDIATFSRISPRIAGVGTALFAYTLVCARKAGLSAINATIRADNTGGLAFYEKIGFRTYEVFKSIPLDDGTPVDRISKKFVLG